MKKTKILAMFVVIAMLVGATLGVSANSPLPIDIFDFAQAAWTPVLPAGTSVDVGSDTIVYSGATIIGAESWVRIPLATPIDIPVSSLGETYVNFDVELEPREGEDDAILSLGLLVHLQNEDGWGENPSNFFRAQGQEGHLDVGSHEGSNSIDYLLDMDVDNMPGEENVEAMREYDGYFRIVAMALVSNGEVTINEFNINNGEGATSNDNNGNDNDNGNDNGNNGNGGGTGNGTGNGGNNQSGPQEGNPKTFDSGIWIYLWILGGAALITAGLIVAPKLIKKSR